MSQRPIHQLTTENCSFMNAIVLIGHGSLHSDSGASMIRLAARLRQRGVAPIAEAGFLNFSRPTIAEAVAKVCAGRRNLCHSPALFPNRRRLRAAGPARRCSQSRRPVPPVNGPRGPLFWLPPETGRHRPRARARRRSRSERGEPARNAVRPPRDGARHPSRGRQPADQTAHRLAAQSDRRLSPSPTWPISIATRPASLTPLTRSQPRAPAKSSPCPISSIAAATCARTCPRFWLPPASGIRPSPSSKRPTSTTTCAWPT